MASLWPATLPKTSLIGTTEGAGDNLITHTFDVGPPKTRARSTTVFRPFDLIYTLTDAQKKTLQTFYNDTLTFGNLNFQHNFPEDTSTQALWKFREPPKYSTVSIDNDGPIWRVTVKLWLISLVV